MHTVPQTLDILQGGFGAIIWYTQQASPSIGQERSNNLKKKQQPSCWFMLHKNHRVECKNKIGSSGRLDTLESMICQPEVSRLPFRIEGRVCGPRRYHVEGPVDQRLHTGGIQYSPRKVLGTILHIGTYRCHLLEGHAKSNAVDVTYHACPQLYAQLGTNQRRYNIPWAGHTGFGVARRRSALAGWQGKQYIRCLRRKT